MVDQLSRDTISRLKGTGSVHIFTAGTDPIELPLEVGLTFLPTENFGRVWKWTRNMKSSIETVIELDKPSVIHIHNVWNASTWYGARLAKKHGSPSIHTFHGILEPWRWGYRGPLGKLKKQIYWRTMAFPAFKHVSAIQAITPLERDNLSLLFPGQRIELIPNAIDLPLVDSQAEQFGIKDIDPFILFLGRIHPMKGVDLLIRAFAEARLPEKWRLVIAGPAEVPEYLEELKTSVRQSCLEDRVDFIGSVYEAERWKWYKRAWVVAMPSHSEVVGMVNIEAAACNTPTITTFETGLWDWEEGGGFLIHPDTTELMHSLRVACSWSESERIDRGRASRQLVEKQYALDVIGQRWLDLYKELSQNG